MIPLAHPILADYLRAARTGVCDRVFAHAYLYDRFQDAKLGVGEPGGPTLQDACLWYARGADEDEPALRVALATLDGLLGNAERAAFVEAMREDKRKFLTLALEDPAVQEAIRQDVIRKEMDIHRLGKALDASLDDYPGVREASRRARAVSVRDLRRRVLGLYRDVEYTVEARVNAEWWETMRYDARTGWLADNGFLPHIPTIDATRHVDGNRRRFCQHFTAADLIPPEPASASGLPELDGIPAPA